MKPNPENSGSIQPVKENFEDFFENTLCGYSIAGGDGKIERINSRLANWLGCDANEVINKRFSDLLTIGGKIYYETHLWPLLRMQGFFDEVALELGGANNQKLQVLVNAIERRDDQGQPLFIRITVFKATDRRKYEENLRAERTIAESNLSHALEISSFREQFIAILGHDLRNPLSAILAGTSLLSTTDLDADNLKVVELIARSAKRMSGLINNVMDFARTRLGEGISLSREIVSITSLLDQVIDELIVAWPGRIIEKNYQFTEPVNLDTVRILQLFSNLLANAITHGSAHTPVIVNVLQTASALEVSISNQGEPISSKNLERIFEPFTRESGRISQNGLGLGLFIASEIAKAHGGKLAVTSTREETKFTFSLALK